MNPKGLFIPMICSLALSSTTIFCCDFTLDTPTERGRCEELIREHSKLQDDLIDKYELVSKTAPKEELAKEKTEVVKEIDHLQREYKKRIQDVQQRTWQ